MEKNFVSELTAQNATETVKTLIATLTVPEGVTKLIEIGCQIVGAGLTTLESVSCILELECDDASKWGGTQQFASDVIHVTTGGVGVLPSRVHDCAIPVQFGTHIKCSTTFNAALTVNPSVRIFGKFA